MHYLSNKPLDQEAVSVIGDQAYPPNPQSDVRTGKYRMGNTSLAETKLSRKTINAVIIECVIAISFFILFHSGIHSDSFHGLTLVLLLLYPLGISICAGIVIASIAETRRLVGWKWGMMATAMTLVMMLMMVCVPTMWSGLAFIIAPLVSMALLPTFMNSSEKNHQQ